MEGNGEEWVRFEVPAAMTEGNSGLIPQASLPVSSKTRKFVRLYYALICANKLRKTTKTL
jgi:hypothetical protein